MNPRSHLYVPGDRPDRFDQARDSGVDAVIIDLEDAVATNRKPAALEAAVEWLMVQRDEHPQLWVRVNRGATIEVERLAHCSALVGICLPKVESAQEVALAHAVAPHLRLAPLVESAVGLSCLTEIAAAPAVAWLHLGELDLAADLGVTIRTGDELSAYRAMIVLASRVAGLPAPPGPVSPELDDLAAFETSTHALSDRGFQGRACIHPRQVTVVNDACRPTPEELSWAQRVLAQTEQEGAVFRGDGQMVDEAVLRRARQIVSDFAR